MVRNFLVKEIKLMRLSCAIGVAAVIYIATSGTTEALPIAPLPSEVTTDVAIITPVYYYRGRYYPYRWHGGYYPYRWHGGYYRHRYYRYGGWRYY